MWPSEQLELCFSNSSCPVFLLNNSQTAKPQAEFLCILSPASLCTKNAGFKKKKNRCPPDRSQRQKKWLPRNATVGLSSPTLNRAELNRQHQVHGLIYRHISNYTAVFSEAIHQLQKMSNLQKLPVTFDTVNTWGKECFYRSELARKVTIQI